MEVLERREVLKEAERIKLIKTDLEESEMKSNCSLDGNQLTTLTSEESDKVRRGEDRDQLS